MRFVSQLLSRFEPLSRPVPEAEAGLDFLDPGFLRDPYPIYDRLRRYDPVHRTKSGAWLLTRATDIVEALSNSSLGNRPSRFAVVNARNRERYVCASVAANVLPYLDKPEHIAPRKIVAAAFRQRLREVPVDAGHIASELLRPHLDGGCFDLVTAFGKPLSVRVVSRMLGLPDADAPQLSRWSDFFFRLFAPFPSEAVRTETDTALAEFRLYLAEILRARRAAPGDDLISMLASTEADGERLADEQVIDNAMLLFSDGIENVDAAIANVVLALHRHHAALAVLRMDPRSIPDAVEEGLRYDGPAQLIARVARDDLVMGSREIKRDSAVFLALGSANRDPAQFDEPERFLLSRQKRAILSFGKGRHSCIGGPLVRIEMQAALSALLSASHSFEVDASELEWVPRFGHRWLKSLPVSLRAT